METPEFLACMHPAAGLSDTATTERRFDASIAQPLVIELPRVIETSLRQQRTQAELTAAQIHASTRRAVLGPMRGRRTVSSGSQDAGRAVRPRYTPSRPLLDCLPTPDLRDDPEQLLRSFWRWPLVSDS
jgi:hypothetical protein